MKQLEALLKNVPVKSYKKNKLLLAESEPVEKIFFLLKGNVRQYLVMPSGEEINIHIFRPGSFFPIMLFISGTANRFYFRALTDIKVKTVKSQKVIVFLKNEPRVLYDLTKRLALGLNGMLTRLENALGKNVRNQLLSLLAYLAGSLGKKGKKGIAIQVRITHKDLANWLGTSRETISRIMKRLENENLISYNKRKIVFKKGTNY